MAARAGHPQNAITACAVSKNPDSQSSCPDQERQNEHENKNHSLRCSNVSGCRSEGRFGRVVHQICVSAAGLRSRTKTKSMNALKFTAVLTPLIFSAVGRADPLDTWTWRNPFPPAVNLSAVAYGNGQFVAVGRYGTILQSGSIITLSITPNADTRRLTLSLEGPTGLGYTIQSSTDLMSWLSVTNITTTQPGSVILDVLPADSARVFYRAYSQ